MLDIAPLQSMFGDRVLVPLSLNFCRWNVAAGCFFLNVFWMLRRKGPYEIIVEVLRIASRGSKKTCIRESVGMNYPQFVRYLEALQESGLLIEESGLWQTTKKGLIFVVACEKCCSILNDSIEQRLPPSPDSQKQFRTMRHQT